MKVLIAGDFCPRGRLADAMEQREFNKVLGEAVSIVNNADYSIVNLECPVTQGNEKPIQKLGSNLHCTEIGIEALKWTGFNCVTLANNHIYDFGDEGVATTLEMCGKNNMDTVGGGHDLKDASRVLYKLVNNQVIAIINCCEHEFSIATNSSAGSNPLNPIQQYYSIQEARNNADYVLVIVHGGHEHFQLPSLRMVETYRFFIDAGADAVVNHHQHCYSGYEMYHNKPIIYGLGNFCFDHPTIHSGIWTEGYMVTIDFAAIHHFVLTPYSQCAFEPKIKLLPQDSFSAKINELNSTIADKNLLQSVINKYYDDCANIYSDLFEPIRNKLYLGAKHRGWLPSMIDKKRKLTAANYVLCESHRDKLSRWLEKK